MNKQLFADRVRLCQFRLYHIALAILSHPADAQDAVQEALISAWEKRAYLRDEAFFETWLTRILINRCRSMLRKRSTHPDVSLENRQDEAVMDTLPDIDLRRALNALDEANRLPLIMHCALQMSIKQVAQALRMPQGVVKWRIEKAKRQVRRLYGEEGEA